MRRMCLGFVALALPMAVVAAQRAACTGSFRTPDGEPIADARVTFVQIRNEAPDATLDRRTVDTEDDGVFTADLLGGYGYGAWAIGPADAKGAAWVSDVSVFAAAGAKVEFVAIERRPPIRVTLRGVEPWRAHLPPTVRVLVEGWFDLGTDRAVSGDGEVALGPWPGYEALLALVDGQRQVLSLGLAGVHAGAEHGPRTVRFRGPGEFDCEVRDGDGRPVSGAVVTSRMVPMTSVGVRSLFHHGYRDYRRIAGRSDETGSARVLYAADPELAEMVQWIGRPISSALSISGRGVSGRGGFDFDDFGEATDPEVVRFHARADSRWRLEFDGFGSSQLEAATIAPLRWRGRGGHSIGRDLMPTSFLAADGGVEVALPANAEAVALLARIPGADVPTVVVVPEVLVDGARIRRDDLAEYDVQVRDAAGDPLPGCHLQMLDRKQTYPNVPLTFVADGAGRARVLAAPGDWFLAATDGWGVAGVALDGVAGRKLALNLRPAEVAKVQLVDAGGKPLAGGRLVGGAIKAQLSGLGPWPDAEVAVRLAHRIGYAVRSDDKGRMRIPLPAGALRSATFRCGALRSLGIELAPGEAEQHVVLR